MLNRRRGCVTTAFRNPGEHRAYPFRNTRSSEYSLLCPLCSCHASAEHFQQCAEFPLLRNRGLGPLAVTVLAISLTRRGTATACAAVQSTARPFSALATGKACHSWSALRTEVLSEIGDGALEPIRDHK